LPWVPADLVFAAQDAEEEALRAAPWLHRRQGPLRKPDELLKTKRHTKLSREERLQLNAARIRETEQAITDAGPDAEVHRLRQRLAAYKGQRAVLLNGRR
jgi:hypothetical protein